MLEKEDPDVIEFKKMKIDFDNITEEEKKSDPLNDDKSSEFKRDDEAAPRES